MAESSRENLPQHLAHYHQADSKAAGLWRRVAMRALYRMPWLDWPPLIRHVWNSWQMRR